MKVVVSLSANEREAIRKACPRLTVIVRRCLRNHAKRVEPAGAER